MSRKFYLASMLVPALAVTDAYALGVGGMRLQSALNQPFAGEIELLDVKSDELDTIKAQIAPQAEFNKAGVERYHHLGKLRLSPQLSPRGNPVIRITSREPIREPYMDFLVEVVWPNGRLVKQFTLLLDPAVTASRSAPPIEQPMASARPARTETPSAAVEPPLPARARKAAPPPVEAAPPRAAPPVAASSGGFPKRFGPIRPGTGLWRLARGRTPAGATVSQTAMALYRNNQDAFIRGDINRLIVGKTLTIPSADELFALGPDAASREFTAALKGDPVRRAPLTDPTAPPQPALAGESRLKIAGTAPAGEARAATAGPGAVGMEEELLLVREASESTRQETVEMRGRIRDLESQLSEIQRLLQLRNAELARIQGGEQPAPGVLNAGQPAQAPGGPGAGMAGAAAPGGPGAGMAGATAPGGPGAGTVGAAAPGGPGAGTVGAAAPGGPGAGMAGAAAPGGPGAGMAGSPASGAAVTPEAPPDLIASLGSVGGLPPDDATVGGAPGELLDGSPAAAGALPLDAAVGGSAAPGTLAASLPTAPMAVPSPASIASTAASLPVAVSLPTNQSAMPMPANTASPVASAEGDSAWRALLLPLAGVAAATALGIGVLMWLRSRRRIGRDSSVEFDSREVPENLVLGSARKMMSPGVGQNSELRASAVPGALDSPSAAFSPFGRVEPETEEADVISEADIYIAYGRYREAEELLRDELKRSPDRLDLQFKLAEAYYGAKNSQALGDLLRQVQATGGDQVNPERWKRLVNMAAAVQPGGVDDSLAVTPVRAAPDAGHFESSIERFLGSNARTLGDAYSAPSTPSIDRTVPGVELLRDSFGGNSDDVYSLDISDARKPSADLALREVPRPLADPVADREVRPVAEVLSGWSPSERDKSAATPPEPSLLSGSAPDRQPDSDPLHLEVPPSDDNDRLFSGGLSDLELTIEDLRAASELDLRTFDDTASGTTESGTTGDRSGPAAEPVRPKGEMAGVGAGKGAGTVLPVLFGTQEDSASSDLLSSQWPMDPGLWDETATKLDLARAYVEMGDQDSAKGILEEVLSEGNEEQRGEAQVLLRRIG
ncbi:FimV/HubP family polar landmark protein [uncultured Lamprocystis sp.]|jgi:pilus assembly protein FimV|uniref:FimV/HubP family polar landmark protein n=1 Tax=uncultured Lamprocystis sp. TaxID=543132 RepID=UPI0025FF7968|nr:FimV/HubP family polar landmark protein [uncultured Lamprocystis sp.]